MVIKGRLDDGIADGGTVRSAEYVIVREKKDPAVAFHDAAQSSGANASMGTGASDDQGPIDIFEAQSPNCTGDTDIDVLCAVFRHDLSNLRVGLLACLLTPDGDAVGSVVAVMNADRKARLRLLIHRFQRPSPPPRQKVVSYCQRFAVVHCVLLLGSREEGDGAQRNAQRGVVTLVEGLARRNGVSAGDRLPDRCPFELGNALRREAPADANVRTELHGKAAEYGRLVGGERRSDLQPERTLPRRSVGIQQS